MSEFTSALIAGVFFCVVLAVAGGVLTQLGPWYDALRKPSWKPPDWAFGPIWTGVFICVSAAIAFAWEAANAGQRTAMLWVLAVNGLLNIAWSGIFFVMRSPRLAMIELVVFWLSIAALIFMLGGISSRSGLLLLPYICWVTAAGVLNFQIIRLNRA